LQGHDAGRVLTGSGAGGDEAQGAVVLGLLAQASVRLVSRPAGQVILETFETALDGAWVGQEETPT